MKKLDLQKPVVKIVLYVLPIIIIAPIFFFAIYQPKTKEIKTLMAAIEKTDKSIKDARKKVKRLPGVKDRLKRAKLRYAQLKKFLPEENEISDLLRQVSDIGIRSGLKVVKWEPKKKKIYKSKITKSKTLYEIPVQVSMQGSYHKVGTFLGRLTNLDRIINIRNLKLSAPKYTFVKEDSPYASARAEISEALLSVNFQGSTFSSIPSSELEKMKAKTSGKKKKRRR